MEALVERAREVQAALDAGLEGDPWVRAEMAGLLAARHREQVLHPKLEAALASVTEERLRSLYQERKGEFVREERRQAAVLWLKARGDDNDEKVKAAEAKLGQARESLLAKAEIMAAPETGFSVWSIDHSEHVASRFKGGLVGWFAEGDGSSPWQRVVAETVFQLEKVGAVSPVVTRAEGVFLVRWTAVQPEIQRSFETVREALEREERLRVREGVEAAYRQDLKTRYPGKQE